MIVNNEIRKDSQSILLTFNDVEKFDEVMEVIKDLQFEQAGFKSKRQVQKELMRDMENQIAELLKPEDIE